MSKTRINLSLDQDLAEFAKAFAAENRISVADMVTQYLLALKRRSEEELVEHLFAHPAFSKAMEEAQARLRAEPHKGIRKMRFSKSDRGPV